MEHDTPTDQAEEEHCLSNSKGGIVKEHTTQKSSHSADEVTPVLIVGGSLVGLSAALFLSWFGIPVLLVERHAGVSIPRAGGLTARTMELFRMAGAEEAIRQAEPAWMQGVGALHAESLAGKELGWITDFIFEEGEESHFAYPPLPVRRSNIPQLLLEPILQTHARTYGADLRFNTELTTFSQDGEGITAILRDRTSSEERTVHAGYLLAADGSEGSMRDQLGIALQGPGTLAHQLAFRFEADPQQAQRGRRILICYVDNPRVRGPLLILSDQEAMLYTTYHPERGEREEDFRGERGIEVIRSAFGIPDLAVRLSSTSSWELRGHVAERFQQGRVFLVGDSAHLMPPSGGLGANTGIADAYNLAWKLALVLQGKADPSLLVTYEAERRLVAQSTMEHTTALYFKFWADQQPDNWQPIPVQNLLITASGYRYQSTAILSALGDHEAYEDPRRPTGRPGSHAAHLVLEREGARCSTFDLFGRHFVLLTGREGAVWCEAAKQINPSWGAVLHWYRLGEMCDYLDVEDRFAEAYGVKPGGAVLVRPDGFIAWRAEAMEEAPQQVLESVLLRLLGDRKR